MPDSPDRAKKSCREWIEKFVRDVVPVVGGIAGLYRIWQGYSNHQFNQTAQLVAYGIAVTATVVLIIGLAVVWVVITRPPEDC